ncbi:MAG: D-2-hydroxyacid dehydrogenase [Lachnospiraceae bacterium]
MSSKNTGSAVLVTVPFPEAQKKALEKIAKTYGDHIRFVKKSEVTAEDAAQADALIGNIPPALLSGASRLSWVQLNSAGADAYTAPGILPEKTVLTCATGAYGTALSEYIVCMLLVMMKKIPGYLQDQREALWQDEGPVDSPAGKRILLVGTGDIGLSFARRIRAFEEPGYPITLSGIRHHADICPKELDEVHPVEALKEEVSRADVIVLSLPGTGKTFHLVSRDILASCKEGAYLLNAGRGSALETAALADPSISSRFAGIWLDVFEQEPLPKESPLYKVPNLYMTPHIAGGFHLSVTLEKIGKIAAENYLAFHGEGTFRSVVNRAAGYAEKA